MNSDDPNNFQSASLPYGISGEVIIRVTDTNRKRQKTNLDTFFVNSMFIEVDYESISLPDDPIDLSVSLSGKSVSLSWTSNSSNVTDYIVERKVDSGFWEVIADLD